MAKHLFENLDAHAMMPMPTALISCADREPGTSNIITLGWVGSLSSVPPMVGIGVKPNCYSHDLIQSAGEFVVNLPSEQLLEATDMCGVTTGAEVDKWALTGLTPSQASKLSKTPLIEECPVNLECVTRQVLSLGSHTLFLAEVVAIHADEAVLDGRGKLDIGKVRPINYFSFQYWPLGAELIGTYGMAAKKAKERIAEGGVSRKPMGSAG